MSTLLLRLAGPLQAWGTASRYAYRFTDTMPSKSAVIGLLAAAQGVRRNEPIEDLLSLEFGVRCDQPGKVVRDFQTARSLDGSSSMPLTYRFYLGDAAFVAGVSGSDALIDGLVEAIQRPAFPPYLGRRSCPPSRPLLMRVVHGLSLAQALREADWEASDWYQRRQPEVVRLEIVRDASPGEVAAHFVSDQPVSFDPHHRRFGKRAVVHEWCQLPNERFRKRTDRARFVTDHSPLDMWEDEAL